MIHTNIPRNCKVFLEQFRGKFVWIIFTDIVKVKNNDIHKYALKLRGFLFTSSTKTVGHLWESKV